MASKNASTNLTEQDIAVPERLYTRFREPLGVFATMSGVVLARDTFDRTVEPATVARAANIVKSEYSDFGQSSHAIKLIAEAETPWPLIALNTSAIHGHTLNDATLMGADEPWGQFPHAALGCYIPPHYMMEKFSIPVGACGTTGQLLPGSQATGHPKFVECKHSKVGSEVENGSLDVTLLDHITEIENLINNPTELERPVDAVRLSGPESYDTDAPVTDEQKAKGITAWRRLENPADSTQAIMLPIYDTERMPYASEADREAEAKKVPRAGDEGMPENYIDYDGILYPLAVTMVGLRDSPSLLGQAGTGKGSPLDEPVLTPTGWRAIGDLEVGDRVIGSSGENTRVTGIFDRGVLPTYRVTMTDGSSVRVDGDHLWSVKTARNVHKTVRTIDLFQGEIRSADGTCKYRIPLVGEVEYDIRADLPIHPYVLGAMLANGYSPEGRKQVYFSSNSTALRDAVSSFEDGWSDASPSEGTKRLSQVSSRGDFIDRWVSTGLSGVKSASKFIPEAYLKASISDRRLLLAGMMDCDGSTSSNGSRVKYSTTSSRLRDGVVEIVRSLGGTAVWHTDNHSRGEYHIVAIHMNESPFMFGSRGYSWAKNTGRLAPSRGIRSVERIEDHEIRCISVKASDSLYVTKDFIVTHNTTAYRHLAYLMSLPYTRISITPSTEVDELAGHMEYSPETGTSFRYGRLASAWTKPGVICLDEPNSAKPDVWFLLRPLLDSEKQLAIDINEGEILPRHESSYLGMAMNPSWDYRNAGTNPLADADVSRLYHVQVGMPPENVEADIIRTHCAAIGFNIDDRRLRQMRKIATDLRDTAEGGELMFSWGTRSQLKVARLLPYFTVEQAYQAALGASLEPSQEDLFMGIVRGQL